MARARPRPKPQAAAAPAREASPLAGALWALIAIAAAILVFRGALPYFFAQDDFAGLARARGLLPPVAFPWRWLSGQFYFDAMRVLAGLDPLPYRLVTLATHAMCAGLVYALCRRFAPPAAAATGAAFFGTHPALFTALYSVSGIGEILAAALALASVLLVTRRGNVAWFAVPLFAASLLSKESTLLLPCVALLPALRGGPSPARPDSSLAAVNASRALPRLSLPLWAMLGLVAVYLAAFLVRDVFGVRASLAATAPYTLRFDRTLLDNLLTYLGWTVTIALPLMKSFTDAVEPHVWAAGIALGVGCVTGFASHRLRRRGWSVGIAWFGLALLPVLPLGHHTYHYYLYAPLAGIAVLVASATTVISESLARSSGSRIATIALGALVLGLTLNGARVVQKIETYPMEDPGMRADATVDRARIAANAMSDLRAASLGRATQLRFWSPVSMARQRAAGGDTIAESYAESNVRVALSDGLAARIFAPQIMQTRFARTFEPAGDSVRYAIYLPDGHLRVGSSAELDSMLRRNP